MPGSAHLWPRLPDRLTAALVLAELLEADHERDHSELEALRRAARDAFEDWMDQAERSLDAHD